MNSREAFEAALTRAIEEQKDPRFYSTIDAINWAWQAAIQHARAVAVKVCAEIHDDYFRQARGGDNTGKSDARADAADDCADAIKEALK